MLSGTILRGWLWAEWQDLEPEGPSDLDGGWKAKQEHEDVGRPQLFSHHSTHFPKSMVVVVAGYDGGGHLSSFSFAVIKTRAKSTLGKTGFVTSHMEGTQGRN